MTGARNLWKGMDPVLMMRARSYPQFSLPSLPPFFPFEFALVKLLVQVQGDPLRTGRHSFIFKSDVKKCDGLGASDFKELF